MSFGQMETRTSWWVTAALFTKDIKMLSRKRTASLLWTREEAQKYYEGCCAASGTGCLESVQATMKPEAHPGILEWNTLPSVRNLYQMQVIMYNKEQTKITDKKTLDCSEVVCCGFWSESNWIFLEVDETLSITGRRGVGQIICCEVYASHSEATESIWLQLLPQMGYKI